MTAKIVKVETIDVRFPTSRQLDGSDAMNPAPDYSAAYVVLHVDDPDVPEGHGFTFTIGRGTELAVEAARLVGERVPGMGVAEVVTDLGGRWRHVTGDSQLRWLGPDKGAIHLGTAAVVNAVWDMAAKLAGQTLWQYLASFSPQQLVDLVDWRYLRDALTPEAALELLQRQESGRAERVDFLL